MEMNKKQKAIIEAIGNTGLGEFPSIVCPMLDHWISANPKEHKEFLEKKFGYRKV